MPVVPSAASKTSRDRVVMSRLVVLSLLVGAVALIAALAGYERGRGSVDQDALQAKAYAQGQLAARNAAKRGASADGARAQSSADAGDSPSVTAAARRSHVITGPSAEVRAQLRRAYRAGVTAGAARLSGSGRALGAAAVLGNFPGGWATGQWYVVRLAPGSARSGGQPTLASRLGPLTNGHGYTVCGGNQLCGVTGR